MTTSTLHQAVHQPARQSRGARLRDALRNVWETVCESERLIAELEQQAAREPDRSDADGLAQTATAAALLSLSGR